MSLSDTRFLTRRRALSSALAAQRIDAMLVTHLTHVRYLSGFSGSNAALLVHKDLTAQIATDGRYLTQIADEVPDIPAIDERQCATGLLSRVTSGLRVGYEADYVTVSGLEQLRKACPEDVTLVPVRGEIEKIRLIKDSVEQQRLREVAALASQAYEDMLAAGEVAVGRSERDIAADLEYRMRTAGSERVSFDTIVASGPNSAKPHHSAGDRLLAPGDIVTFDFGAHVGGFNSDMTRTVMMSEATDFAREIYEIVLEAQLAGVDAARAGTKLVDVDRACRDIISAHGYGEYFVHSTGHGVGLDVHEAPSASTRSTEVLAKDMTLTIEPGIYVPGRGGVRIEDTLIITDGAPEIITKVGKDLYVV